MKKILLTILKIGVSGAAIYWVLSNVDIYEIFTYVMSADYVYLCMALMAYIISQVISAERINVLYRTIPLKMPFVEVVRLYWLGMFYNFFLPGGVGGDGYKVYYLKKHYECGVKRVVSLLLSDRVSGLVAIVIYILFLTSTLVSDLPIICQDYVWIGIPFAVLGYYAVVYVICRSTLGESWKVLAYSMVIQGLQMFAAMFIALGLGCDAAHLSNYVFLFFISSIASAIPISIAGIGLREATFAIGSQYLSVDDGLAVALSIVFYFTSLVASMPGITYMLKPEWIKKH
ncbi:MAG: lysylphosphatidylglycerol synthase transmembrane domain-containing protein [Bacteroidia bacterium]|nr:lysylphosphatidylglycerol synthase transmembrane domain-containing protein [Bacteroidia bacterium]